MIFHRNCRIASHIARMIAGEIIPRAPLLQQILESLEEDYQEYCRAGFSPIREDGCSMEAVLGKKSDCHGNSEYYGVVTDCLKMGNLL